MAFIVPIVSAIVSIVSNPVVQLAYKAYEYTEQQKKAKEAKEAAAKASATYSQNSSITQCNPNAPIPIIYGEHKVAGNIIWQGFNADRTIQYLFVALCRGPVESISEIKVNDNDIGSLSGCTYTAYLGTSTQTVDSRCSGGPAVVGGLKNLAYLALSLSKTAVGEGVPNVTCKVKGKKVTAYSGTTRVSNLLTANQADAESTTGFNATSGAGILQCNELGKVLYGSYSLKTTTTGGAAGQGFYTSNTILTELKPYSAFVWLKGTGIVKLYLEERTDTDVLVGITASDPIMLNSDSWTRHSIRRDFGATGKRARIKVLTDSAQAITWYTDQLMLYEGGGVNVWMAGGTNTGWSDNPAWCLLDLMLNSRDGVGYSPEQIDLNSFNTVAQYCDEVLSANPYQVRFKLNFVFDWKEEWIEVFNKLRMNFHAYAIVRQGKFCLKQMIPETSAQSFNYLGDIVPDSLALNWAGLDQEYDVVRCYYTDPGDQWTRQYSECRNTADTSTKTPRILEIELYGTTSDNQASRIAAFHYRLHKYCKITGQFTTSIRGADRTPGDIIDITDPRIGWDHRLVMITNMQEKDNHDIQFSFQGYDLRVYNDQPGAGPSGATVNLLGNKFTIPGDPSNLDLSETKSDNVVGVYKTAISVNFTPPSFEYYSHALIQISEDGGATYRDVGTTSQNQYRIEPVTANTTYHVRVKAVSDAGLQSSGIVGQITPEGNCSTFESVNGLTSRYENNILTMVWNPISDLRPFGYEIRKGSSWSSAITLGTTPLTRFVTQGSGIYWVSAVYNGVYSVSPASIEIVDSILSQNILMIHDEYTSGWQGEVSGGAVKVDGVIKLAGSGMFDDITDFDNVSSLDFYGGIQSSGTYNIPTSHQVDIGVAENCNILGSITISGEAGPGFAGEPDSHADGKIYIRIAQDDGIFGAWSEFIPGPYLGRVFDFKVELTSMDANVTAVLSRFAFTVDMSDKYDQGKDVWVETSGSNIPFNYGFHAPPQLLITVLNADGGETVVLRSNEITKTNFKVQIKNASGTPVRKQINWVAKGY